MRSSLHTLIVLVSLGASACGSDAGADTDPTTNDSSNTSHSSKGASGSSGDSSSSDDAGAASSGDAAPFMTSAGGSSATSSTGSGGSSDNGGSTGSSGSTGSGGSTGTGGSTPSGGSTDCGTLQLQQGAAGLEACMHTNCCKELKDCDDEQNTNNDACVKTMPCTARCQGKKGDDAQQCMDQCAQTITQPVSKAYPALFECYVTNCNQ